MEWIKMTKKPMPVRDQDDKGNQDRMINNQDQGAVIHQSRVTAERWAPNQYGPAL